MPRRVWVSNEPVVPEGKEEFDSGLDAMIQLGVQVFFVNKDTFEGIDSADDQGYTILKQLQDKEMSENQKRGKNVKEI